MAKKKTPSQPIPKRAARRSTRAKPAPRLKEVPVPGTPQAGLPLKKARAAAAFVGPAKGNKAEACRKAGYSDAVSEHHQARVFDAATMAEVKRLLKGVGLTDELIALKHRALIDAQVRKYYQDHSLGDHTDNTTQLGALELAYKLRGMLKDRTEIHLIVEHWTEQIVQVIVKYVREPDRAACLQEALQRLSIGGPS